MNETTYINFYREFSETVKENSAEIFNNERDNAFEKFCQTGFPTKKNEEYLYSHLPETLSLEYGLNIKRLKFELDKNTLFECKIPSINATLAFMVNDNFYISENQKFNLPKGVIFCSISEAEKLYPEILKKYLFQQTKNSNDSFVNFNSTFSQNGYFLYIQQNTVCEHTLQLINLLRSAKSLMTFSHNLIVIESGAAVKILLCDHIADDVDFFISNVTEIFVENNAKFDYYSLENTSNRTNNSTQIFVNQQNNSKVVLNNISLTNAKTRKSVEVDIDGENANLFLGGMLIGDNKQEVENSTIIRHKKPNSTSNELFKYILDENSHGIFSGRIIVEKEAQKTESRQTNRNICLTKNAVMHARPQLEIYADDVKCGHGATTGQLDNEALFYMYQRGIDEKTARLMLLAAFVQDVIDHVEIDVLRERLKIMVEKRLKKDNSFCEGCFIC